MFFANGGLVTDEKEPRGFAPQAEPAQAPAPQAVTLPAGITPEMLAAAQQAVADAQQA